MKQNIFENRLRKSNNFDIVRARIRYVHVLKDYLKAVLVLIIQKKISMTRHGSIRAQKKCYQTILILNQIVFKYS